MEWAECGFHISLGFNAGSLPPLMENVLSTEGSL